MFPGTTPCARGIWSEIGHTYFVSASTGNDSNNGRSVSLAKATIQAASDLCQPGDIVNVMNGNYTSTQLNNSGAPGKYITYKRYPGHNPFVSYTTSFFGGFLLRADYIVVDGFEIKGNSLLVPDAATAQARANVNKDDQTINGCGLSSYFPDPIRHHHQVVRNCYCHNCSQGGIVIIGDFIWILNNFIENCCNWSPYAGSGISFQYQSGVTDGITTYKNFIIGNKCFNNHEYVNFTQTGTITDGNGIIIDIQGTNYAYPGKTLVANNVSWHNGGTGMHTVTARNVDFINNTCWFNQQSHISGGGSLSIGNSANCNAYNNIVIGDPSVPQLPMAANAPAGNTYNYNTIYKQGTTLSTIGANDTVNVLPLFTNAAAVGTADFSLTSGSTGIGNANTTFHMVNDILGTVRPSPGDRGAYQT